MGQLRNVRHELYCQKMAGGMSAADAMLEAGYKIRRDAASKTAWQLNIRLDIKERIAELMAEAGERSAVKVDNVLRELARIAFFDPRTVISWKTGPNGSFLVKDSDRLSDAAAAAIAEVIHTSQGVRVKFHNKLPALEMLGKYLQLWQENQASRDVPFAITDTPQSTEQWLDEFADKSGKTQH